MLIVTYRAASWPKGHTATWRAPNVAWLEHAMRYMPTIEIVLVEVA